MVENGVDNEVKRSTVKVTKLRKTNAQKVKVNVDLYRLVVRTRRTSPLRRSMQVWIIYMYGILHHERLVILSSGLAENVAVLNEVSCTAKRSTFFLRS